MTDNLMHVYFDSQGNVLTISPTAIENQSNESIKLPILDLEDFLLGKKSTHNYIIKKIQKHNGEVYYKFIEKFSNTNITRSLDTYLIKVEENKLDSIVQIITNPNTNIISISLNRNKIETLKEDEEVLEFLESGPSYLYFTENNNPYYFKYSLTFLPPKLYNEERLELEYPKEIDLSSSSVYTKRLVSSYSYTIMDTKYVI